MALWFLRTSISRHNKNLGKKTHLFNVYIENLDKCPVSVMSQFFFFLNNNVFLTKSYFRNDFLYTNNISTSLISYAFSTNHR